MDITDLPNDLFIIVASYLEPEDCIRCQRVSKNFCNVFSNDNLCKFVIQRFYPRAREVRNADDQSKWAEILSKVAGRYHFLKQGRPRSIEKIGLASSLVLPAWSRRYSIAPWQRVLHFEDKTAPFHYQDLLWTYEDGLIIYPSATHQRYVLLDLNSSTTQFIPLNPLGKVIRRIRLCDRVLILEWCEAEPYHQLNKENEMVYRHFATAFDIEQDSSGNWTSSFRNEWRIHFLGFPLNSRDRFFSVHNKTHYAIYTWQPNRSPYGEGDPIEALAIWDISTPSSYLPSEDPAGKLKKSDDSEGANLIRRFSFTDLEFYDVRQRSTPALQGLELDEGHLYVVEEDHRWLIGPQANHHLPRLHKVKTVGIPLNDIGPAWMDECGADGDVHLSFCQRDPAIRQAGRAPCWRHEEFPYLTITEAIDAAAGVRYYARHCFMLEAMSVSVGKPALTMTASDLKIDFPDDLWQQMLSKGKIYGDERFLIGENGLNEIVILHFDNV